MTTAEVCDALAGGVERAEWHVQGAVATKGWLHEG